MGKRKKFLFLGGSFRDSVDLLSGFAQRMLALGHEVLFVAPEKNREAAIGRRLPFRAAGPDLTSDEQVAEDLGNLRYGDGGTPGDHDAADRQLLGKYLPRQAEQLIPELDEIVAEFEPDVIVHDVTIPGLVPERYRIPGVPFDGGMGPLIAKLHTEVMRPALNRIREKLGLPEEPVGRPANWGALQTPMDPEVAFDDPAGIQGFRPERPRSGGGLPAGAYQTDGLKAYVELGPPELTGPKFETAIRHATELAVRELAARGIDTVVMVGSGETSRYRYLEGDHILVADIADRMACMEAADFAVLPGGYTAALDALASKGKGEDPLPVLYVPQGGGPAQMAKRFVGRGALTIDPNSCTKEEFAQKVQEVIDERARLAAASRAIQGRLDELRTEDQLAAKIARDLGGPARAPGGDGPPGPGSDAGKAVIQGRVEDSWVTPVDGPRVGRAAEPRSTGHGPTETSPVEESADLVRPAEEQKRPFDPEADRPAELEDPAEAEPTSPEAEPAVRAESTETEPADPAEPAEAPEPKPAESVESVEAPEVESPEAKPSRPEATEEPAEDGPADSPAENQAEPDKPWVEIDPAADEPEVEPPAEADPPGRDLRDVADSAGFDPEGEGRRAEDRLPISIGEAAKPADPEEDPGDPAADPPAAPAEKPATGPAEGPADAEARREPEPKPEHKPAPNPTKRPDEEGKKRARPFRRF